MKKEEEIKQPDGLLQERLNALYEAKPEEVKIGKKKYKIGWITNGTQRKFTDIMATEKDPHKTNCKLAAVILLNGIWKIRFMYWFLWRWFYYIKDMDNVDILRIIDVAKKKVQLEAYFLITTFSTEMTDVMMTMTKAEVSRIRAVHNGEQVTV